jgi:rhamnosyltransferase
MKIGAIIVLYNPEEKILNNCLASLRDQVSLLVVVDNSPVPHYSLFEGQCSDKYIYCYMNGNSGIATAQNKGIDILQTYKIDYVLFMDQDSIAPLGMVKNLVFQAEQLAKEDIFLGAVGPRAINRQSMKEYKGKIQKGETYNENTTEVTELISSGSLIPFKNFDIVGKMEDTLFIDIVDYEWCWRASLKAQYRFFICEQVKLSHQFGEGDRHFYGLI